MGTILHGLRYGARVFWLWSGVLVFLLALTGLGFNHLAGKQGRTKHPYILDKPLPEPVVFGEGVISTGDYELDGHFTPDGKTFYFARTIPVNRFGTILFSRFINGKWSAPEAAPFTSAYIDYDPFIQADGSKLYFDSNRPVDGQSKRGFDIWVVEKTGGGWGAPKNLNAPVNTDGNEFYPSVAADGALYFSSTRGGGKGGMDIWRSRLVDGKYSDPENLGEAINTQLTEVDSYIAPDQSFIVFAASGRPDSLGDLDLYISFNRGGVWTKAVNLGAPINSSAREYCPGASPDGRYFFFTSERGFMDQPEKRRLDWMALRRKLKSAGNGFGDIYQIDMSVLKSKLAAGD